MRCWAFALGLALAGASCGRRARENLPAIPPADSQAVALARAVADSVGDELWGLLGAALDRGGPALAIRFCADSAQQRTLRHWRAGVYVRRVSDRVRNVDDTPDAVERQLLERLAAEHRAGRLPAEVVEVIRGADGSYQLQYLRPILVEPRCLPCHGDPDTFSPDVRQVLAQRYPEDRATGYAAGDLRGAISVRVALGGPR